MIKIIDSLMGTGKTTWAIRYMLEHQSEKFIFAAQYLAECDRICAACNNFYQPQGDNKSINFLRLLEDGCNIAMSHELLKLIVLEPKHEELLKDYTLFLDESLDMLSIEKQYRQSDVDLLNLGKLYGCTQTGRVVWDESDDTFGYATLRQIARAGNLYKIGNTFYAMYSLKIFSLVKEMFVMTYLFEASDMYYCFRAMNVPFEKYYLDNGEPVKGSRSLAKEKGRIRELIEIHQGKINDCGYDWHALSYKRCKAKGLKEICNKMTNVLHYRKYTAEKVIWSAFKLVDTDDTERYADRWIPYNQRASNEFRSAVAVAYLVNVFCNPEKTSFFAAFGVAVDQELFALSTMLQFIWRSAIRDSKPILLILPSRRMRCILEAWFNSADMPRCDPLRLAS